MLILDCFSLRDPSFLDKACSVAEQPLHPASGQTPGQCQSLALSQESLCLWGGLPQLAAVCSEQCPCGPGPGLLGTEDLRASQELPGLFLDPGLFPGVPS